MKLPKPAAADVDESAHQVTLGNAELAAIRAEIATAEASLPALAESDDDAKYEETSLHIERLRRSEMRAQKRLNTAREALVAAKTHKEQERRRSLFEAGLVARAEAEKLAGEYAKHAAGISEILRAIDKLRPPVEAANADLPEGERTIDAHALGIHSHVELPAATKDGQKYWWRAGDWTPGPLDPPPRPIMKYIELNGAFVPFDARNPAHLAVREARPPTAMPPASMLPPQPANQFGERTLPDGSRKIKLPPNEWPPKPASASN